MVFHISILAESDILDSFSLVQNIATGINILGIAFFAGWLVFRKGSHTLEHCPVRKNRMPYILPFALFLAWAISSTIIREYAFPAFSFEVEWHNTFAQELTITVQHTVMILIMLLIGHFFFDKKLKGLGFRLRTLPGDIIFGAVHLITVHPIITIAVAFIVVIARHFNIEWESNPGMEAIHQNPQIQIRILLLCYTIIIVPLFEELLFRGLIQSTISAALRKPWIAIFMTSGLFSILHPPMHWPAIFILSCGMGYAYEKSGSLLRSIFMHAMFNGMNISLSLMSA